MIKVTLKDTEAAITLQEAITFRNFIRKGIDEHITGMYWYAFENGDLWAMKYEDALRIESELTSQINELQQPVAQFLNRLPET